MAMQGNPSKWALFAALAGDGRWILPDGRPCFINAVEREDGSGRSYNVTATLTGTGSERGHITTIHVYAD